jgi:hypothetical protein
VLSNPDAAGRDALRELPDLSSTVRHATVITDY